MADGYYAPGQYVAVAVPAGAMSRSATMVSSRSDRRGRSGSFGHDLQLEPRPRPPPVGTMRPTAAGATSGGGAGGLLVTTMDAAVPMPRRPPPEGWAWRRRRRQAQKEQIALSTHLASPVFGLLDDFETAPRDANLEAGAEIDVQRPPRSRRPRLMSLIVSDGDNDGQAAFHSGDYNGPQKLPEGLQLRDDVGGCARFYWAIVAAFVATFTFPLTALAFTAHVLFTVVRSLRKNVLRPLGVTRFERIGIGLNFGLFILLIALSLVIVFFIGPEAQSLGFNVVGWCIAALLVSTTLPVHFFMISTPSNRYWNRVPGGLTRPTIRWTFANVRAIGALLFTAVQLLSFPLARLRAIVADANTRVPGEDNDALPGLSDLTPAQLEEAYAAVQRYSTFLVGLLPIQYSYYYVLWLALGAVAVWIIWLAIPVAQQLLLIWWVGALQPRGARHVRKKSKKQKADVAAEAKPDAAAVAAASSATVMELGSTGTMATGGSELDQVELAPLNTGGADEVDDRASVGSSDSTDSLASNMTESTVTLALDGSGAGSGTGAARPTDESGRGRSADPDLEQARLAEQAYAGGERTALSQFAFDLAIGSYFTKFLFGLTLHGLVQYLLGDLFYVSIASTLLRSVDCTLHCVNTTATGGGGGGTGAPAEVCAFTLDAQPDSICWLTWEHQMYAAIGLCAFFLYVYTATFATPLMADVLEKGDKLDIRTTPRFVILDRITQVLILVCYVLIDESVAFVPVGIHAVVGLVMVIMVERTRPGSDRTVLLRSWLYQIHFLFAGATLTAYARVPWLPFFLIVGGFVFLSFITFARYLPLRRRIKVKDLRFAVQGIGRADDNLDAEGLVRVRGKDLHLLEEGDRALDDGRIEAAIGLYKRALFNGPTQVEAASRLMLLSYDGRYPARFLLATLRLSKLFIKHAKSGPRLNRRQNQLFRVMRALCELEIHLPLSERFADLLGELDYFRRKRPRDIYSPYAWTLLALLYERVAFLGPSGLVNKRTRADAELRRMDRAGLLALALECLVRGAGLRTASGRVPRGGSVFLAKLHLARFYMDGLGTPPNPAAAIDQLTSAVARGCTHAYYYLGIAYMHRAATDPTAERSDRQEWLAFAYDAWRFGAQAGDTWCEARLAEVASKATLPPLSESRLPRDDPFPETPAADPSQPATPISPVRSS